MCKCYFQVVGGNEIVSFWNQEILGFLNLLFLNVKLKVDVMYNVRLTHIVTTWEY